MNTSVHIPEGGISPEDDCRHKIVDRVQAINCDLINVDAKLCVVL